MPKQYSCLICGKLKNYKYSDKASNKYCSIACQSSHKKNFSFLEFIEGKLKYSKTIKPHLAFLFGEKCSVCGIESWNNKKIVLELEHKDGNSLNNHPSNLCLMCPNCHSQTTSYKGKNKGNGRYSRRQRYKEGKSF